MEFTSTTDTNINSTATPTTTMFAQIFSADSPATTLLSTIAMLFIMERIVVFQLLNTLLPQLKKTTTILRGSNMALSTLHTIVSFGSAFHMFYTSELNPPIPGVYNVDYYLKDQYKVHMLMEFGWYLFDTMSEVSQMISVEEEPTPETSDNNGSSSSKKKGGKKTTGNSLILQAGFLLHHFPPLFGLYMYYFHGNQLPVATQRVCAFIIIRVLLWHFTTPMQNLRWFMDKLQVGEDYLAKGGAPSLSQQILGTIYRVNFATFMVGFFAIRIYGVLPLLKSVAWLYDMPADTTYAEIVSYRMPVKCVFLTGILYALSAYWFYLNARRAFRVFSPKNPKAVAVQARQNFATTARTAQPRPGSVLLNLAK